MTLELKQAIDIAESLSMTVYSKSDQENVTVNEVRQIIKNFKLTQENCFNDNPS
jgi:hypothetical protein